MTFTQSLKRPIGILYKRLSCPVDCGRSYSTIVGHEGICVTRLSDNIGSGFLNYSNRINSLKACFHRYYSSEVSASEQMNLIKQLRERTSAPIKEVKSALVACNWDIDVAQKELRKRGVVLASKKSTRTAAEGFLALAQNQEKAVIVELNCETDFVARNDNFKYLALSLAKSALLLDGSKQASSVIPVSAEYLENLKMSFDHPKFHGEKTVQDAITEVAAMMGENVKVGGGFAMSAPSHGVLSAYLHTSPQPGIGRIAGLLSLEVEGRDAPLDTVERVGAELAMHVVAARPLFLTREDVASDALGNERDILRSQAESTGKSQMAIDKMIEGRLRKYFEDVVLMEQKFVVNDTVNIQTVLNNLSKEVGSTVRIGNFLRVEVGEGHKRSESVTGTEPLSQAA